jgi:hypothetical protein
MKKFLLTCGLFLLVFFLIDKGLILLRNSAPNREVDKRLEMILNGKIQSDILIYGSSRGGRDIIASEIEDSLKLPTYNLSFPGSAIEFHEFLLSETLKNGNKKPSVVVLVVDDPDELLPSSRINFRLDRLYPLIKYGVIRDKLVEKGGKNYWLSKLFIVHQLSISNFDLRPKHFKPIDTLLADGSMPINFKDPRFTGAFINDTTMYDVKKERQAEFNSFTRFVDLCHSNNIKLVIACPPNFYKPTVGFSDRIAGLVKDKAFMLIHDTNQHAYSKDPAYYYDDVHLNKKGARLFTAEIVDFIRKNNLVPGAAGR